MSELLTKEKGKRIRVQWGARDHTAAAACCWSLTTGLAQNKRYRPNLSRARSGSLLFGCCRLSEKRAIVLQTRLTMTVINSLNSFDDDYFASLKALSCVFDTLIESSAPSPPFPNGQTALVPQSTFDNPFSKQRNMTPPDFIGFSFCVLIRSRRSR